MQKRIIRLRRACRWSFLPLAALLLAGAGRVALWRPLPVSGDMPADGWVRVGGAVHVHTRLSDGGGTPDEVVKAARDAGLRFVAITDHGHLDAKPLEGYHDGVLLLVGTEISTTAGHLLALGTSAPGFRFSGDPLDALDDIRELGGHAFAAHPDSNRPDLRFTGWSLPGPWGLELINGDSQWRAAGWAGLARTAVLYALNSRYSLLATLTPPEAALESWDRLLQERDVPGLAGADAHSRIPLPGGRALRFPSYAALFDLLRVYALVPEPLSGRADSDAQAVLAALGAGRSYMAVEALAPADGFSFALEGEAGRWTMGDSAPPAPGLRLRAGGRLPAGARLRLLKDGSPLLEQTGWLEWPSPGPGVYRVEVYAPGWRDPVADLEPDRGVWHRAAAEAPAAGRVAGAVGSSPHQASARQLRRLLSLRDRARSGLRGRGHCVRARRRGRRPSRGPSRFSPRRLRDAPRPDLLLLDRPGRMGPLRRSQSALLDQGQRRLQDASRASRSQPFIRRQRGRVLVRFGAYHDGLAAAVALPIERFRSVISRSDGRLDLDQIREIAFVIDGGAMPLGSHGCIWLDELGTD